MAGGTMCERQEQRLQVGGEEIAWSETGHGEPLLLVHAGVFSDWFLPMAASDAFTGIRLIHPRRAGYANQMRSSHLSVSDHAGHCGALLDHLGVTRAHFCGHSSSALIGLQLAMDRPGLIHTLTLLDPAPGGALLGPKNADVLGKLVGPAMSAYASGDSAGGFEQFMTALAANTTK